MEGLGDSTKVFGTVGLPMCFHLEKKLGSYIPVSDDPWNEKGKIFHGERDHSGEKQVPDDIFRTTIAESYEVEGDSLALMSLNHQRAHGIRLDLVQNVAEMWNEEYGRFFELQLAQTPNGLPIRVAYHPDR